MTHLLYHIPTQYGDAGAEVSFTQKTCYNEYILKQSSCSLTYGLTAEIRLTVNAHYVSQLTNEMEILHNMQIPTKKL